MAVIRVLDSTARCMQRMGYLKRLVRRVMAVSTSSLENLGNDLTQTVMRRAQVPLNEERATYIRQRLYDRVYDGLKKQAAAWGSDSKAEEVFVAMELQDLYLADPSMPSQTGKLVRNDGRKYPRLGVALGLIRAGTYSLNTRALSLLHLTPKTELQAFLEYDPGANPLRLTHAQGLLFLYALLENDGEVIAPLLSRLASEYEGKDSFSDRDAGDCLPEIYHSVIERHRRRLLSADERERIDVLSRTAGSVEKWRGQSYSGGGAREEASRPRVEPYADIGLLCKPDPFRYGYAFTPAGQVWAEELADTEDDAQIADFLANRFFQTAANAFRISPASPATADSVVVHLYRAWEVIHSAGGYAPIEEMAVVAGIEALLKNHLVIEPAVARETLIAYQKENPYQVRFTVNRLGELAHARFLESPE